MKEQVFKELNERYLDVDRFYMKKSEREKVEKENNIVKINIDEKILLLGEIKDVGTNKLAEFKQKIENLEKKLSSMVDLIQSVKSEKINLENQIKDLVFKKDEISNQDVENNDENIKKNKMLEVQNAIIKEKRNQMQMKDQEINRIQQDYAIIKDSVEFLKGMEQYFVITNSVQKNNEETIKILTSVKKEKEQLSEEIKFLKNFYNEFKNLELNVESGD